jgi:hypothetical protein
MPKNDREQLSTLSNAMSADIFTNFENKSTSEEGRHGQQQ